MSQAPAAKPGMSLPVSQTPQLLVSAAPHLSSGASTQRIMFEVVLALVPLFLAALYFFGLSAIVLVLVTLLGCLAAEAAVNLVRGRDQSSLYDGSAVVTAVILAFSLPPTLHPYMAFLGGAVAILLAKAVFGGLGQNLFNPAMVGRAFLMICFPAALVTWVPPAPQMDDAKQALAEDRGVAVSALSEEQIDAITTATPLYQASQVASTMAKAADAEGAKREALLAEAEQMRQTLPSHWRLFVGNVGGCLGETSALAALLGGLYLVFRRVADYRPVIGVLGSVFLFGLIAWLLAPEWYQSPLYYLNSGALVFGAFFIATDYVGAPLTPIGRWIFGIGVGVLVMVIRLWGAYPEGFMFAILIMNAITPLIERWTTPTPFGGHVPQE